MAIVQMSILSRLKLSFVPVLLLIFLISIDARAQKIEKSKVKKIVIDAGHGGKDPGTCGRIFYEKDIVLGVALRLGMLIEQNMPDIQVLYTRKKDVFLEVYERADIANNAEADLFISVHANAVKNTDVTGYEAWIMGLDKSQKNMEVAMRENAVIEYEEGYENRYEMIDPNSPESYIIFSLMQNTYLDKSIKLGEFILSEFNRKKMSNHRGLKQGPFLVLWRTAAPSVLVEVGFLSNIIEEQRLGSIDFQQEIAESIYKAVQKYRNYIDGVIPVTDSLKIESDTIKGIKQLEAIPVAVKNVDSTKVTKNNTSNTEIKAITNKKKKKAAEKKVSKSKTKGKK